MGALQDAAGNKNIDQTWSISEFTDDVTPASLQSFVLDMDLRLLHLTFDDIVNSSIFSATGLTIQNTLFRAPERYHTLSDNFFTLSDDGFVLTVTLWPDDLNEIKYITNLATEEADTWLTVAASTVDDIYGRDIKATTNGNATQASLLIPDETPPVLVNFTVDLDTNTLYLTYSEAVDNTEFVPSTVELQGSSAPFNNTLVLDGSTNHAQFTHTVIAIYLLDRDVNQLTENTGLATGGDDTYIYLYNASVVDPNDNYATAMNISEPLQVAVYIPDMTAPVLVAAGLDMNAEVLYLTFSETVQGLTLDPTQITIQD